MQTPDNNQHHLDEALEAPTELVAALKRLPQERVFVPPAMDEALLRAACTHLAGMSKGRLGWFGRIFQVGRRNATTPECVRPRAQQFSTRPASWEAPSLAWWRTLLRPGTGALRALPWAAAAVVVALLVAMPSFFKRPAPGLGRESAIVRWDINHDGRMDILDAFALARQLKQGGTPNLQLDVNGDGVVDERDVAAIAARAVKLEQGGRS